MRAEQRSVGQVANVGGDYEVEIGPDDTRPNPNRAWWNFQQSIAYDGAIETSTSWSSRSAPMPAARSRRRPPTCWRCAATIDDRNNQPNPTATYGDLYQTSQNPLFGWLTDAP